MRDLVFLIVLLVLIVIVSLWKNHPPKCDDHNACARGRMQYTYTTLVCRAVQVLLVLLIILYTLKLLSVPLVPLLSGCGIVIATLAFALKDVLADLSTGVTLILSGRLTLGSTIRLSIADCGNCFVNDKDSLLKVYDFGLFGFTCTTNDTPVYVRYNSILAIEQL